ncbi:MAG: T9SS type A sorting domain-containing protein [Chitinophagaceae bacterium]|jgi:hypothetical protein
MRRNFIFLVGCVCSLIIAGEVKSQSRITGVVKGLANGDSAIVRIQKASENFFFTKIGGNTSNADIPFDFPNLSNGKWALSIDAKGYLFPVAKSLELNNNTLDNIITLTKAPSDSNFSYQWQDDSSYVGHAQQAYINDKVEINVLGVAEKVPDDFNAINLLNEYGFLLSDAVTPWTSEDAYRLYQMVKKLNFPKFGERDSVRVKSKWVITNSNINRDLDFTIQNGVFLVTISRSAFTYATPQVVTVDGVKGKFFSKRLFTAVVYFYTDKGTNKNLIDEIARTRYGFSFMVPSPELKTLMSETETNFQEFTSDEKLVILSMIEEFPDAMQRQDQLKYMVRRINGQPHPLYPQAPAIAWVTNQNIEWMEGAFIDQNIDYMQRLVLHEKAHFLWAHTFDTTTKNDWATLGGWFKDPASLSGWSTSNTTEFVSAYAHLKNPDEDMAESIAFFITNPDAFRSRSIKKFEFVRDRIMKGTRYISIIRPDLTFQVYNLFPDYNYPGKIKRTKIDVYGKADEDKRIVLEIELTIMNKAFDGGDWASGRFQSSIGTIKDISLSPVNAEKSILRGEMTLSKYAKSGYWIVPQLVIGDRNGNMRLENNTTYGLKCFVNNPMEDVVAPLYKQNTLKLDSVQAKIIDFTGSLAVDRCGSCADTLTPINAIKVNFDMIEKNQINPDGRALVRMFLPTFDSTNQYNIQPYSFEVQINGKGIKNDFPDSMKTVEFYFPIPDYYPSGYYAVSSLTMSDLALNYRSVLFDKDTANKEFFIPPSYINQRALRDSIYFKTKYPDMKPPVLDLNDIQIKATPTNPEAPNGETLFEMWAWIKDESDFPGFGSGFAHGSYTLRDPQGLERFYSMQPDLPNLLYTIKPDSSIYGFKRYYFKTLLPQGSPPGLWGVSSITLEDHAKNKKYYSFTEIVRFDVEQSKVLQVNPYVEIVGKKVNAANAEAMSVVIGCKSCKTQNYRIRMYSSMGGNSVVYEGVMTADTITLNNLKLTGVNDGILYATVFMLDSSRALIGTGRATYTKDTQIPRSQQLQTNLANFGKSNLDSLIISIQTTEKNGSYNLVAVQSTITPGSTIGGSGGGVMTLASGTIGSAGDSLMLSGTFTNGNFQIPVSLIKSMLDGVIELRFYLIDSVGNVGEAIKKTFYKDTKDPVINFKKSSQTGLNTVMTLTSNEFVSNSVSAAQLSIKNATLVSVEKLDSKNFKITLTRSCADTLGLELKAGVLLDTVGNVNAVTTYQLIDTLVPLKPQASAISYCQGGSANPLTATVTNGNTLQWYGTAATGGTASGTAPTPSTADVGTLVYYVSQKNTTTACESPRASIEVTVNLVPSAPTISRDVDGNLVSSAPNGNQWYRENTLIQGATGRLFKPSDAAYYTVKTTRNGCTSVMSDTYYFVVTALSNLSAGEFIRVIPNPVQQKAIVDFTLNGTSRVEVQIMDAQGRIVWNRSKLSTGSSIDLGSLKSGLYLITFKNKETGKHHVMRIIKN